MPWSDRDLTRLAFCEACRQLSDTARGSVPTIHDRHLRPGELLREALRLRADAEDAVRLAIAAERQRGASWQQVGEELNTTRQAAHERYAAAVEEILEGILFPARAGPEGGLGWWACPDGLEDPDRTAAQLDAWVLRHVEPADPDRGEHPVSQGFQARPDMETLEAIGRCTELADRLINDRVPAGVSKRLIQRMLLEAKLRAHDLIAAKETGERTSDARHLARKSFEELVAWHQADVRERLGHVIYSDDEAAITLDGRPVRWLARSDDPVDEDARGWFLWSLGDQSATSPISELEAVPAVLHAARQILGSDGDGEFVAAVDAAMPAALALALDAVCDYIASDSAKGFAPFDVGGIAGPDPAS